MRRLISPLLGCVTLGLAPFVPEPHVVGKLRWVLGGAKGMAVIDWFDLALHGAPWLWLAASALQWGVQSSRADDGSWAVLLCTAAALVAAAICVAASLS